MATSQQESAATAVPTVFVSYSRADRKRALPVIRALERAGYAVWWDGLLEGGERYLGTTEAALEGARAVVVLWSRQSHASHWVHDEAMGGRDRRCLVPLSLDGTLPPLGFRQFQTIDFSSSRGKKGAAALDALLRAVAALHDRPPPAATSPPVDRRMVLAGGAALLTVGGGAAAWQFGLFGGNDAAARSVAVLPFDNLSGDPARSYFSDGLAAEVRAQLARNPLLQVAAQASSNKFRKSDQDARAISRALGVGYLLDGNVRPAGNMVRVSAELIDGKSGFSRWAQSFDRPLSDVFSVQEEIARAVTSALAAEMQQQGRGDQARTLGGTANLAAYDAYLRGRDLFDKAADEASDRAALAAFEAAVHADPRYSLAHAALSRSLAVIGNQYDQGALRRASYERAVASADRAVRLAPALADAHSALGFALFNGRLDARAARTPYQRSLGLGGGDADVLSRFANYSARCGRFDAARPAIARSAALDPLNARTLRLIGEVEYSARNYAEAIPPIRRALGLNPGLSVANASIGSALLMLGRIEEARAAFEREPSSLFKLTGLAIVARRQDRAAEARDALDRLVAEHGDNGLYQQAQVRSQWGEKEAAMALLDKALAAIDAGLVYLRNDPFVDPLRPLPGFARLLNRIGFD
jgi:TolB-like protein/Tfp pilus assembly protein PilF